MMKPKNIFIAALLGATLTYTFWDSVSDFAKKAATKGMRVLSLEEALNSEAKILPQMSKLRDEIYELTPLEYKKIVENRRKKKKPVTDDYNAVIFEIAEGILNAPKPSMPKIQELVVRYSRYKPSLKPDIESAFYWSALNHTSNKDYFQARETIDMAVYFAGLSTEGERNIRIMADMMYDQAILSIENRFYRDAEQSLISARYRAWSIEADTRKRELEVIEAAFVRAKLSAEWGNFEHAKEGVEFAEDVASHFKIDTAKYKESIANAVYSTTSRYIDWKLFTEAQKGIYYGKEISETIGGNWASRFSNLESRIPQIKKSSIISPLSRHIQST